MNYGASASFGWQHHRKATDFLLLYSLSYTGMTRYSELNAPSQTLTMTVSRQLAPKWTFSLAGSAQDSTQSEFLHQPTGLSVLSQLPATIDDLAAAFSIGQFSNSQIASMFTGANMVESPARSLLLGNRVLSYSGTAGLNYAYSSRLSFHFATVSAGGQSRRGGQNGIPARGICPAAQPRHDRRNWHVVRLFPPDPDGVERGRGPYDQPVPARQLHERQRFLLHARWGYAGSSVSTVAAPSLRSTQYTYLSAPLNKSLAVAPLVSGPTRKHSWDPTTAAVPPRTDSR